MSKKPAPENRTNEVDLRWLVGPDGGAWLSRLAREEAEPLALVEELRRQLPAPRVGLLMQQADLRRRARAKFDDADNQFFTALGLQQATDIWTARYKATRFARGEPIADLCCGIGGDLMALAERGPVLGIDRSIEAAVFAEANLRSVLKTTPPDDPRRAISSVRRSDAEDVDLHDFAAWHIDPDRRPSGRRTTRPDLYEPGVSTVDRFLAANPHAAMKLAPAAVLPEAWEQSAECEWIGRDRECRQLVAWFGALARSPGERRATALGSDGTAASIAGQPCPLVRADRIGRYLFEPASAVLAARLEGRLAEELTLGAPNPSIPYLTGDAPIEHPLLAGFEVLETLPLDRKRLRRLLAERRIGRLEIKKRGVSIVPEQWRRQLKPRGAASATLLLFPWNDRNTAVLAQRLQP